MTRKNWLSALLAVIMVISMMACVALPAVAASALTLDEAKQLPLASAATASDAFNNYQINSIDELLRASHASVTSNPTANSSTVFKKGDVIYITTDLDLATWDPSNFATYDAGTGKYTTIGNFIATKGEIGAATAYLKYDASAAGVECDTKEEVFAYLWNGFNARAAMYTYMYADIDGLGHTLSNFYTHTSFLTGDVSSQIRNLTFKNYTVDSTSAKKFSGWTGAGHAIVMRSLTSASVDNVHLIGCNIISAGGYTGGFLDLASNDARPFSMVNCSMIDCTVRVDGSQQYQGLLVGGYRTKATITLENVLVYNSTFVAPTRAANHGMLIGWMQNGSSTTTPILSANNVAVIDCTEELTTVDATVANIGALAAANQLQNTSTANNIYFAGNKVAHNVTGTGDVVTPVTTAIVDAAGQAAAASGVANGAFYAGAIDGTPLAINDVSSGDKDVAAAEILPGLDLRTAVVLLNEKAPLSYQWKLNNSNKPEITDTPDDIYKVTFISPDYTVILVSGTNGSVTADAETIALLSQREWAVEGTETEVEEPWNKAVSGPTVYVPASHLNHIEKIDGDNAHHKVVCDECSNVEHNYTVTCAEVTTEGVPTSGGYYAPGYLKYTCVCGNTWNVDDPNAALPEAPITVGFDAESYRNSNAAVNVALGAKGDAGIMAYTAVVTYDPTYMTYTGYSTAFNCFVNDADAATGKLVVAFANADGLTLNSESMTLNFVTANITKNTDLAISVSVDEVAVDDGTNVVYKTPLTTTVEAEAIVYYVDPTPKPDDLMIGDVNGDKTRDLLDAVLVIQKINSTIPAKQEATFIVWAADCDGDNQVTTNDVTVLLRNAVGKSVVWIGATEAPIVVAPIL